MPNYALSINSTYQPFTYQELVAPVAHQQQVLDALSDEYDKMSSQADILEAMGANDRDKRSGVYSRFKAYSDDLRAEADNLFAHGLNSESRQRLSNLRRRYNQEIVPIQNAWNKREQEATDQMKASLSNPSLMFTRDARNTSLDDYIANPTGGYGVINGALISQQMSAMAKNLAKQVRSGNKERIDDYTFRYIEKYGLDENLIRNWQDSPTLTAMFNQVMKSNGVTSEALQGSMNANDIINKSTGFAQMGMWEAMGDDKTQMVEDFKARLDAQAAKEIYVNRKKAEDAAAAINGKPEGTMIDSIYQLPMMGADFKGNKEQETAMTKLGYKLDAKNNKLNYTGKVQVKYYGDDLASSREEERRYNELQRKVDAGTATEQERGELASLTMSREYIGPRNTSRMITKEASLYDKNGKMLNREQFIKQASNKKEREAFEKYYEDVMDAQKTLGIEGNLSHGEISKTYNTLRSNSAAQMANVRSLNYEKADWNATSKNYVAKEIKSYKKGEPVYDSKTVTLGELLNRQVDKKDINVSAYWSDVEGKEGLILATTEDNGKPHRYFIAADNMPESNIQTARQYFRYANEYKKRNNLTDARKALETAYRALHFGLTDHNKGYDQELLRQLTLKQLGLAE